MELLKVHCDNLEWEDPLVPFGPIYVNKPFSGICFDDSGHIYYEDSYVEGKLDGRSLILDTDSNRIIKEGFYWKDVAIGTHFHWIGDFKEKIIRNFENGKLQSARVEDSQGNLLLEYNREKKSVSQWFTNGVMSFKKILYSSDNYYQFQLEEYWDKENVWLMTLENKTNFLFNEDYLINHSFQLETEEQCEVYWHFSKNIIESDKEKALNYLHKNLEHPQPLFRYDTISLLNKINDSRSIPFLEKRLNDEIKPEGKDRDYWGETEGSSCRGFEHTISKMAEIVLEDIRRKYNS